MQWNCDGVGCGGDITTTVKVVPPAAPASAVFDAEICFDFYERYDALYAQVHHQLGLREGPRKTKLEDLLIVCASCHTMIHVGGGCHDLTNLIARARPK